MLQYGDLICFQFGGSDILLSWSSQRDSETIDKYVFILAATPLPISLTWALECLGFLGILLPFVFVRNALLIMTRTNEMTTCLNMNLSNFKLYEVA